MTWRSTHRRDTTHGSENSVENTNDALGSIRQFPGISFSLSPPPPLSVRKDARLEGVHRVKTMAACSVYSLVPLV